MDTKRDDFDDFPVFEKDTFKSYEGIASTICRLIIFLPLLFIALCIWGPVISQNIEPRRVQISNEQRIKQSLTQLLEIANTSTSTASSSMSVELDSQVKEVRITPERYQIREWTRTSDKKVIKATLVSIQATFPSIDVTYKTFLNGTVTIISDKTGKEYVVPIGILGRDDWDYIKDRILVQNVKVNKQHNAPNITIIDIYEVDTLSGLSGYRNLIKIQAILHNSSNFTGHVKLKYIARDKEGIVVTNGCDSWYKEIPPGERVKVNFLIMGNGDIHELDASIEVSK